MKYLLRSTRPGRGWALRIPLLIAALALCMTSCAEIGKQFEDLPQLTKKDLRFKLAQSSRILDRDGNVITTLHQTENRTIVPLRQIPKTLQRAVVAIEDERFYQHEGVDLRAILRALVTNASSGEIREGGSTITQQYVKNVIIAPGRIAEKTLRRKIVEAALSRQIEKELTKKEILERYLNTVYFGQGAYGVQAAALTYFAKPASQLDLAESATLAGIIRSPEEYDPYKHPGVSKRRRNTVLNKMDELSWAKPDKVAKAKRSKLKLHEATAKGEYPAPYFVDYVQRLITYDPRFTVVGKTVSERTNRLFQGGLRIHTTVDLDMQAAAEEAIDYYLNYPTDPAASMVALDPNDGQVRAMVGGHNWFATKKEDRFSKLNLAIMAEPDLGCERNKQGDCVELIPAPGTGRQAGSAFKPFALAAAIDEGVPLSKTYKAAPCLDLPDPGSVSGVWHVCNYEGGDFGDQLSLLEGTVSSVNVVYAQVIQEIGNDAVVETADAMGINTELPEVDSVALGTGAVNPLDMASAYGTLATNGLHHPPVAITKIVDTTTGKVIYRDETDEERVLDPGVAYLTTTALQAVIERGTGTGANIGRPAAGKTGTAQEYRDAWFAGYTPDLVAAVWMGYPQGEIEMKASCSGSTNGCIPTRIDSTGVTGGSYPAMIWQRFMSAALAGLPITAFDQPEGGLVQVAIDIRTGCLATDLTPDEFVDNATFQAGTQPEKSCRAPKDRVEVPNVFSFPVDEATDLLERAGFEVDQVAEPSRTYPPGRVIGQSPDAGERAPRGSTVTIYVSSRVEQVTVPDVRGMTRSEAENVIRDAGLVPNSVTRKQGDGWRRRRGRVWEQDPGPGARVDEGSTVTFYVNPG
ncbi:MAG: transglycosylase domain-containing protein [Actinomycetota bacterium]